SCGLWVARTPDLSNVNVAHAVQHCLIERPLALEVISQSDRSADSHDSATHSPERFARQRVHDGDGSRRHVDRPCRGRSAWDKRAATWELIHLAGSIDDPCGTL